MPNKYNPPAHSYYAATANPSPPTELIRGDVGCDVCVIGGGSTGLSAALHAAERGYKVAVIEAERIGYGASGRNGGLLIPGLRKGALDLIEAYGVEQAKPLFDLADSARDLVHGLIAKHGIQCDLKETGHLMVAHKPGYVDWMRHEVDALTKAMGYQAASVLGKADLEGEIGSRAFHGGLLDSRGGHYHPLNYVLGLAHAAVNAGAVLYEETRALRVDLTEGVTITTKHGQIKARYAVLACDALIEGLDLHVSKHIMPIAAYILATEPLGPDAHLLIPRDRAINDTRNVVNYFRLSADGRLIFGGGERLSRKPPADIASFVRRYAHKVFPRLQHNNHRVAYSWGGLVSVTRTRLPHFGRRGQLFFAHGYSGQGALLATLGGKLIAEAMMETAERFDLFARTSPAPFPGGKLLRTPLHVAGMLWYALRDRI